MPEATLDERDRRNVNFRGRERDGPPDVVAPPFLRELAIGNDTSRATWSFPICAHQFPSAVRRTDDTQLGVFGLYSKSPSGDFRPDCRVF
jgi:hypothetical protein